MQSYEENNYKLNRNEKKYLEKGKAITYIKFKHINYVANELDLTLII